MGPKIAQLHQFLLSTACEDVGRGCVFAIMIIIIIIIIIVFCPQPTWLKSPCVCPTVVFHGVSSSLFFFALSFTETSNEPTNRRVKNEETYYLENPKYLCKLEPARRNGQVGQIPAKLTKPNPKIRWILGILCC